ncbi:uncharacterized protein LOC133910687 [Phragmites australis]|uniref:uncharacterized protein LOC133910687 n=1 Tax=Phragmites australis TaxID=29695 RepID=UPI002D7820ED|nr:uncharacterized protein LOC133910687 [Phragmites australis]
MDFEIAYNVILGCLMLDKFMAIVHYVYQALKILGPKGVITVKADQRAAVKCDKQSLDMVEHFSRSSITSKGAESKCQKHQDASDSKLISLADTSQFDDATKEETNNGAKDKRTNGGVKAMPLDPSEPAKTVKVRAGLDPK